MSNDTPTPAPAQEVVRSGMNDHKRRLESMTGPELVAYALTGETMPFNGRLSDDLLIAAQLSQAASQLTRLIDSAVRDDVVPLTDPSNELGLVQRICEACEIIADRAHDEMRDREMRDRVVAMATEVVVDLVPESPVPAMGIADAVLVRADASVMQVARAIGGHLLCKGATTVPIDVMAPWLRGVAAEKFLTLVRREVSS